MTDEQDPVTDSPQETGPNPTLEPETTERLDVMDDDTTSVEAPTVASGGGWSRRRTVLTWGAVAVVGALVLGGATAAIVAIASPPSVVAVETEEPEPEPTPTETRDDFEVVQFPVSVLPLTCDSVVSGGVRRALIADAPVVIDENAAHFGDWAMIRQAGILTCSWRDDDEAWLFISAIPDGREQYEQGVAWVVPSAYMTIDSAGDRSYFSCSTYGVIYCSASMLVDRYFIEATWTFHVDEERAKELTQELLDDVASRVREAGPARDVVVMPSAGSASEWICSDAARGAASAAFDVDVFAAGGDAGSTAFWTARTRTDASLCQWGAEGLDKAIRPIGLPGGAWAIEQWRREQPDEVIPGLAGDGDGVVGCTPDACYAIAASGSDLLALEAPVYSEAEFARIARDFFAAIP